MLFSSLFFLSVFLPAVLAAYYLTPRRARNVVLLVASVLFYAWGDFRYLGIMFGVITLNFVGALFVQAVPDSARVWRRILVAIFVVGTLSVLFYYKYFDFFMINVSRLTNLDYSLRHIIMPLGISFYTFQALSYLVDVYRGEIKAQTKLLDLALFISFFPQLVAGPILKYHDVCAEIESRQETVRHFSYGCQRFIMGLGKKVLIANTMGLAADTVFNQPYDSFGTLVAWGGAVAYSLQLYFDFSGYSDMAIGLGAMFGFHFKENFNYPYVSQSITEFWRRWHISLSTWFKEYLYIPLGGNRVSKARNLLNLGIVFLVTGIWHGAEWTFVVWGAFHGAFILLEKLTGFNKAPSSRLNRIVHHAYLLLVVVVAWVFFRSENLSYAIGYLGNMFGVVRTSAVYKPCYYFNNMSLVVAGVGAVLSTGAINGCLNRFRRCHAGCVVFNGWLIGVLVLSMTFLAGSTYNPFIYFRF